MKLNISDKEYLYKITIGKEEIYMIITNINEIDTMLRLRFVSDFVDGGYTIKRIDSVFKLMDVMCMDKWINCIKV